MHLVAPSFHYCSDGAAHWFVMPLKTVYLQSSISFIENHRFNYEPDLVDRELADTLKAARNFDNKKREVDDALFSAYDWSDKKREVDDALFSAYDWSDKKREI
jgi:hypothetical protein